MKNRTYLAPILKSSAEMPSYSELHGSRLNVIVDATVNAFKVRIKANRRFLRNRNLQAIVRTLSAMSAGFVLLALIGCAADEFNMSAKGIRVNPKASEAPVAY